MRAFPKALPLIGGLPTNFKTFIESKTKVHTLRENADRWTPGRMINFCLGSWRTGFEEFHKPGKVFSRQAVVLTKKTDGTVSIEVDGTTLNPKQTDTFIRNDGFISNRMFVVYFFGNCQPCPAEQKRHLTLIHWTDLVYRPAQAEQDLAALDTLAKELSENPLPTAKLHF